MLVMRSSSFSLLRSFFLPLSLGVVFHVFSGTARSSAPDRSPAIHALLTGHVDEAIGFLKQTLAAYPANGEAHLLLCRAFYAEDLPSEAASECDAALRTLASSSVAQDWAGRAFGMQAGHAGPFGGMKLARRVKTAFEAAASLDPGNRAAVNDLAEYLIAAPGIVGGSLADARALAEKVQTSMPEQAHRIRALLAQKAKDEGKAESEFRAAAAVANSPAAWVDLAQFYAHHHQEDRAVEAVRSALAADKARGPALLDAAGTLSDLHREPALAIATLRSYIASPSQTDESPAFKAHLLLGRLLAAGGDRVGARAEFNAALALASRYDPARKALAAL